MSADLLETLAARSGIVCAVGAGGKKTTLYRLARAHAGRVGITSTVFTTPFPSDLDAGVVVATDADLDREVEAASRAHRRLAFARPSDKRNRHAGLDPDRIVALHERAGFEVTLVKADGARGRWIKAPGPDEPVVPEGATTVLTLVSARTIGAELGARVVHHVDAFVEISGGHTGRPIEPEHVARALAHQRGGLKNVGDAEIVPVINMVDDADLASAAERVARLALDLTDRFDRVALTSMTADEAIVRVVRRQAP